MNLLLTGASGFVGRNIIPILSENYLLRTAGFEKTNDYQIDLSNNELILSSSFDIILHAAGKAHINPISLAEEKEFYDVNYQGTKNLCFGLEKSYLPSHFIYISTVAVYGLNSGVNINEDTKQLGNSAYAKSKILAEQFLQNWCNEKGVRLSILRPSLIAGANPPGNLGAMAKGIKTGKYFSIGKGESRKSILMVNDIANLVPLLIKNPGIYNLCDSHHPSFKELEVLISKQLGKSQPKSIPYPIAKSLACIGDLIGNKAPINSSKLEKITKSLTFSNEKAMRELAWEPLNVLENFRIYP